jgi:hypothetical protein
MPEQDRASIVKSSNLRNLRRLEVAASGRSPDVEERWQAYVDSLPARNLASSDVAGACDQLWINLYELVADIVPPDAGPTNDGGLLMSWDQKGRHLEIEVYPDTSYEWFFRERTANVTESGTARTVDTISDELAHWLRYLLT